MAGESKVSHGIKSMESRGPIVKKLNGRVDDLLELLRKKNASKTANAEDTNDNLAITENIAEEGQRETSFRKRMKVYVRVKPLMHSAKEGHDIVQIQTTQNSGEGNDQKDTIILHAQSHFQTI